MNYGISSIKKELFKKKYNVERNIHIIPTGIEVERFYKEKIDPKIDCGYIRKERWYEKYYKNRKK